MSYNKEEFQRKFQNSKLAQQAQLEFGNRVRLIYDNDDPVTLPTPREAMLFQVTNKPAFSMVPFYYLNFLLEKNPSLIADIGCGANLFKRVIPQIHGIDPCQDNTAADECDFFDHEFSQGHTNQYPSAFSINAIHFISISNLGERIMEFANIIQPGGRGFLAMNIDRMLARTPNSERLYSSRKALADYVTQEIDALPLNFLVVDNLIENYENEAMNGNIRLVFEK